MREKKRGADCKESMGGGEEISGGEVKGPKDREETLAANGVGGA